MCDFLEISDGKSQRSRFLWVLLEGTLLTWIHDSILPSNEIYMATEARDKAAWK